MTKLTKLMLINMSVL